MNRLTTRSILAITGAALMLTYAPARAATLTVTDLGDNGAGTLRKHIADADPGDTIDFDSTGTITLTTGELLVDKNLTIDGPGITVDADGGSRAFHVEAGATVTIEGSSISSFIVRDGDEVDGGGILNNGTLELTYVEVRDNMATIGGGVSSHGALDVNDSHFQGNSASSGGGVFSSGTLTIDDSTLTLNMAADGGALFLDAAAGASVLTSTTISDNDAENGGGIRSGNVDSGGGSLTLTSCAVTGNDASGGGPFAVNEGGGILNFGALVLDDTDVTGNTAGLGGGVHSVDLVGAVTKLTITGSTIDSNTAKQAGGILLIGKGTISSSTTVDLNDATGGFPFNSAEGGGILNIGDLTVTGSSVNDNVADVGGGILNRDTLVLDGSTVDGNAAICLSITDLGHRGGGIWSDGAVTVRNGSSVTDNDACQGGGIFSATHTATVAVTGSTVSGNTAISGAGIANGESQAGGGIVTVTNSTVSNNLASGTVSSQSLGGGIFNFGALVVTGSTIDGNSAGRGGGVLTESTELQVCSGDDTIACETNGDCGGDGPCEPEPSTVTITDTTVSDNRAAVGGGVLNRSEMTVVRSTISGNRADTGGGINNDSGAAAVVENSTLSANVAGTFVVVDEQTQERTIEIDPDFGASVFNKGFLEMSNCTVIGGSVANNGGLFLVDNSIVSGSPDQENCSTDNVGASTVTSEGYNLDGGDTCDFLAAGDVENTNPVLGGLADNGGPTLTHTPLAGSPAIDTGHPAAPGGGGGACEVDDQRDLNRSPAGDPRCDKGALELACGNNTVDLTEECDDGNLNEGDSCDPNCRNPGCANDYDDNDEVCDDGSVGGDDYCSGLSCLEGLVGQSCTTNSDCDFIFPDTGLCGGCGNASGNCGDGVVQADVEECDDGDADDNDECTNDCEDAVCGDGHLRAGVEECDDANASDGDGCTVNCIEEFCGDSIRNNGGVEECDDGNNDNNDGCTNDCKISVCGDGNQGAGEACDDGNNLSGDGCSSQCLVERCGNGVFDAGEECDDANTADGDGCDSNCTDTGCGNGIKTGSEACDDGNEIDGDYCAADCSAVSGFCGNGTQETNEECDDSDTANGDGCDARCIVEFCGDGIANNGEACDDGNLDDGDYCSADCSTVDGSCGDGNVQGNEECDDGNGSDGDGCTAGCIVEFCGDGVNNNDGTETCDDGNNLSSDYCANDCSAVTGSCGDGSVQSRVEECDDSNTVNNDGCDNNCTESGCGNGVKAGGETCDDGNNDSQDYCANDCSAATGSCGDSIVQPAVEQCDGGGGGPATQTATCEADCQRALCGDAVLNTLTGEVCDDGRECEDGTDCTNDADLCSQIGDGLCIARADDYCSSDCGAVTGVCGDGIIQSDVEECDDGAGGVPAQTASCEINCKLPVCGDLVVNAGAGEDCDDGNGSNEDACLNDCSAASCGDGFIEAGVEDCDDVVESAICDADCSDAVCGDATLNLSAGENCDDGSHCTDDTDCTADPSVCTLIGDGTCLPRDGDGCSSTCGGEGVQDAAQQACVLGLNKAGAKVAKARAKEGERCIKKGLRGVFIDAQDCLTEDPREKVQRAKDKTIKIEAAACTTVPGFGPTSAASVNANAETEAVALVNDMFGPDLDVAIITEKSDEDAHRCQARIMRSVNRVFRSGIKIFNRCKKREFKRGTLDSAADLGTACLGAMLADADGRIAKAVDRVGETRGRSCGGVDLDNTLPGDCVGQVDAAFDECVRREAVCRACRFENLADNLHRNCDLFDDGVSNSSCPL